ncbi:MAG: hypothetical protein PVH88_27905 [Ignavibacteria bacterium]|jgi:hypothetical protein
MIKKIVIFCIFEIIYLTAGLTYAQEKNVNNCFNNNIIFKEIDEFINYLKSDSVVVLADDLPLNIIIVEFCTKDQKPIVHMYNTVFYFSNEVFYAYKKDGYLVVFSVKNEDCYEMFFKHPLSYDKSVLKPFANESTEGLDDIIVENKFRVFEVVEKHKLKEMKLDYYFYCD